MKRVIKAVEDRQDAKLNKKKGKSTNIEDSVVRASSQALYDVFKVMGQSGLDQIKNEQVTSIIDDVKAKVIVAALSDYANRSVGGFLGAHTRVGNKNVAVVKEILANKDLDSAQDKLDAVKKSVGKTEYKYGRLASVIKGLDKAVSRLDEAKQNGIQGVNNFLYSANGADTIKVDKKAENGILSKPEGPRKSL